MSIAKIKLLTILASKAMLNDELKENRSFFVVVCKRIKKQHSTPCKTAKFFKGLLLLSTKIFKNEGLVKLIFNFF